MGRKEGRWEGKVGEGEGYFVRLGGKKKVEEERNIKGGKVR